MQRLMAAHDVEDKHWSKAHPYEAKETLKEREDRKNVRENDREKEA